MRKGNTGENGSLVNMIRQLREENALLKQYQRNSQQIGAIVNENQILKSKLSRLESGVKTQSNRPASFLPRLPSRELKSLSSELSWAPSKKEEAPSEDTLRLNPVSLQPIRSSTLYTKSKFARRPSQEVLSKSPDIFEKIKTSKLASHSEMSNYAESDEKISVLEKTPLLVNTPKQSLTRQTISNYLDQRSKSGIKFGSNLGQKTFKQLVTDSVDVGMIEKSQNWRKNRSRQNMASINRLKSEESTQKGVKFGREASGFGLGEMDMQKLNRSLIESFDPEQARIDLIRIKLESSKKRLDSLEKGTQSFISSNFRGRTITEKSHSHHSIRQYSANMNLIKRQLDQINFT